MASPAKLNLKIYQGATFNEALRWESSTKVYKAISNISKSAPVIVSAVGHEVPVGWRVKVVNVLGMKEINSVDDYYTATDVTADTITINNVNALGFTSYASGGVVEYNKPVDLAGYTARMQVRAKLESPDILLELTTENGGITIDNTTKTITILISAVATAAFTFTGGVYSLELASSTGVVTAFAGGTITVVKEVTR